MMKNYIFPIITAGIMMIIFTGCEKFLSESPTKSTSEPIERIEQLVGLLDAPNYTENFRFTDLTSTDNYDLPLDLFEVYPSALTASSGLPHYVFGIEEVANRPSDMHWNNSYGEIYKANLILENVDQVSGDAALKAQIKAEAYFLRAYSNFMLATYYCLPYHSDHFDELGLPYKTSTSPEQSMARMSLKDTYNWIESDLAEALNTTKNKPTTTYRADNKATVNALLSRLYLYQEEWDKVIAAADQALDNTGIIKLKDYNTLGPGTPVIFDNPPYTIAYSEITDYAAPTYFNWNESFFIRVIYKHPSMLIASPSLLDMFDKTNDVRYKWFFLNEVRRYAPTYAKEVRSYTNAFGGWFMLAGVTIQEVMLNKAEALVRKSSPDVAGAMTLVNQLRTNRMQAHTGRTLTAENAEDALLKVLAERRREFPFSLRWGDIRRFAYTATTIDDIIVSRDFYEYENGVANKAVPKTYTLPLKSRRYAVPINQLEVNKTRGEFEQNTY
ncbi:RagB/SusD family nutrient uptake outer membrane protein [Sphingobacterium phlebotomi]|uniref:RagB/SusD family nutrient uptake outer membrane protein n=2 Tax=Sphingobacterium phlebotomi TaxID=2605433 RepID=A0A5D4H297_9SPHI|nr:RagB/SusD family nutrient uptake outer membrane protein [Sphingobacterium phlebotomi]